MKSKDTTTENYIIYVHQLGKFTAKAENIFKALEKLSLKLKLPSNGILKITSAYIQLKNRTIVDISDLVII